MRRRAALLVLAALVSLVAACGDDDDDDATSSTTATTTTIERTTTTTAAPTTTVPFDGDTTPTSIAATASSAALLTDVAVTDGLVTFTFRSDVPGVDASYVDPPVTEDASGEEVDVDGDAFLRIRMEPASSVDLSKDPYETTYDGPDRVPGTGPIAEVVKTGDFEANLTWVIGLDSPRPYRVEAEASMVRVYIST